MNDNVSTANTAQGIFGGAKSTGSKKADRLVNFSLEKLLNKSIGPAKKYAKKQVSQIRTEHPGISHEGIIKKLEKKYCNVVTGSGGVAGGAAALPGVGLVTGVGATLVDTGFFLTATMVHVYAVLEAIGKKLDDVEHERALILTILSGGSASPAFKQASEKIGGKWAAKMVGAEKGQMSLFNRVISRQIVSRIGSRSGAMLVGKVLPFGIGAVVGGGINRALAKAMVSATRETFADVFGHSLPVAEVAVTDK